jgi:hypothetical protein
MTLQKQDTWICDSCYKEFAAPYEMADFNKHSETTGHVKYTLKNKIIKEAKQ